MHKVTVCPTGFRAMFEAVFVLICRLRDFPLPAVTDHSELMYELKQRLPLCYKLCPFSSCIYRVYPKLQCLTQNCIVRAIIMPLYMLNNIDVCFKVLSTVIDTRVDSTLVFITTEGTLKITYQHF